MKRLLLVALIALAPSVALAQFATIGPTPATSDNGDRLATTAWVNAFAAGSIPLASGKIFIGSAGNLAVAQTPSGDCTIAVGGAITCTKTNSVSFAASATTDTTNASNISSGTLAAARGGAGTITGALKGNGVGVVSQAACADLSNGAASCSTDTTNASNISTGTLAAARGGAGTISGALKGNGSGVVSQAACADLSNAAASCSTDATNATNITSGTLPTARLNLAPITNSLGADVNLNNILNFFDGPSVAQGSTGTWWAAGTVTLTDTGAVATLFCKLWDGTTVISSAVNTNAAAGQRVAISLSGFIASPAGNIRISCQDGTATTGVIRANVTGTGKDSTISAHRIQ